MSSAVPRPAVDELLTRWELTQLRLVVVEGSADARFLSLVAAESHWDFDVNQCDIWPVDRIDVPDALLTAHGLATSGAKQKAVAFGRAAETSGRGEGFRAVVDRDLDHLLNLDCQSATVLYTDYGCMEGYAWTPDVLRRVAHQFRCDQLTKPGPLTRLYDSVSAACLAVCAVRLVATTRPELTLSVHHSDGVLRASGGVLALDLAKYVERSQPAKGRMAEARDAVMRAHTQVSALGPLSVINGHDLTWLLTFALRESTTLPRRLVDATMVAEALSTLGALEAPVAAAPLFQALARWASRA